ncbi:MAG: phage tail spike protein [Candidatus Marinimicrobia bacterium]|nr:phage tail spike protein [Candidatus Neomarinimicrobiota bacterium]
MKVSYKTQIENEGWNIAVTDGATSGTTGKGLRLEALIIDLLEKGSLDIAIEAQAHVQNIGWQTVKTDGEIIGTVGEGLRLEALTIRLIGADAKKYKIKYRLHIENIGWQNWKVDGETAGTTGVWLRAEAIEIMLERVTEDVVVVVPNTPVDDPTQIIVPISDPNSAIPPGKILCASYSTHVENYGWGNEVTDGRLSGRVGQGLRVEAIRIALINTGVLDLGVAYSAYVENLGWLPEVANGATAGTTYQGKRLEAIKMHLTGTDADDYSIWYRVHVQNEGWQEWCRDGDVSGTMTFALRAEAIQIIITLKSENLLRNPGDAPLIAVNYRTHIQNLAWASWVKNGTKSGTTGLGLRMEALEIKLSSLDGLDIGIQYRVHVENIGWQAWFADGKTAGTVGQGLRIEAVEIVLTGTDASKYTVQYRGHLENTGWTTWKKNGETLGTTGEEIRLEAVSIVLIKTVDLNAVITNEIKNNAPIVQIWASDFPRADVLLHDIRTDYRLLSAKTSEGINKSSGMTFTIDPTHAHYKKLRKMHTTILVYEIYSNARKDLIFEGRILSDAEDIYKKRVVTCEGELGYLLDSIQRPAQYVNVTPEQWLTMVLDNHNMQVTSDKRLHMGICTVLGDGTGVNISTNYRTHIENLSWLSWVRNGDDSGTTGSGLRMEAIELKLENIGNLDIGVTYRAHLADIGWQEWKVDGATAGTTGQSVEMQAVEIKLTGADAGLFSIQYRVHVENDGWQDWKQDGETAGTTGQSLRAESISIIIVSKVDGTNGKLKDGLFRENEYVKTLELIKTTMLDTLGGVLVIERIGGIKFLNYLENYGSVNSQPIKFGVNMLDYSKITDASGIYTAIVPYGKEIDGKKLTIATANNGCDYIYDELAVAEYGWIFKEFEWPDIDSASALLYAAKLKLAGLVKQGISLELTAIDLSMVNVDIQKFQVGDMARSVSKPHDLDAFLSVSKKERDLLEPGNDRIVLGGVTQSLTDRISGPLGGGIMGFAITTANTVKNMEFVSNELSFLIKITAETVEEQGTTINETKLEMDAFRISLSALESRTKATESSIAETALTITALGASLTSTQTTVSDLGTLVNQAGVDITALSAGLSATQTSLDGKVNTASIIASINASGESGVTINADKLTLTGICTFSNDTVALMASNARTNAVSDVATKLSTTGQTVINGDNIITGTISCNRISGGALNFANITATGSIALDSSSTYAGMAFRHTPSGKFGGVYANASYGAVLYAGSGGINLTTDGSNVTVTYSLTANNLMTTATSGTEKILELKFVTSDYLQIATNRTGTNVFGIWPTVSDRKFKQNIFDAKLSALDRIGRTKIRMFDWIKDGKHEDFGMIAQEAEQDLGENYVFKVRQTDGSDSYQIKDHVFTPMIIKAIQELNAKLTETAARQQNEISILKYQIAELKGELLC